MSRGIARYPAAFPGKQYRVVAAQRAAEVRACRPEARNLEHVPPREKVQAGLETKW